MATTEGAEFTSRLAEETIAPGLFVCPGDTNPSTTCALPDSANDVDGTDHTPIGVAILDPYRTSASYTDGEAVRICTKGEVFVTVTAANSLAGGKVYLVHTTGAVRGTADAGATVLPNAVFKTATASGSVGVIKLLGAFA
jgi:hypothetical protein